MFKVTPFDSTTIATGTAPATAISTATATAMQ